ncbi:hypothetical protein, partial [Aquabacterium sp.]|uniref:hypothetical protein n=1 Tax=Aquabacterium sp. TaxID=1872578 RepID=UPI0025B81A3C
MGIGIWLGIGAHCRTGSGGSRLAGGSMVPEGAPDPLGRHREVERANAGGRCDGIRDRRRTADDGRFADALGAERPVG